MSTILLQLAAHDRRSYVASTSNFDDCVTSTEAGTPTIFRYGHTDWMGAWIELRREMQQFRMESNLKKLVQR